VRLRGIGQPSVNDRISGVNLGEAEPMDHSGTGYQRHRSSRHHEELLQLAQRHCCVIIESKSRLVMQCKAAESMQSSSYVSMCSQIRWVLFRVRLDGSTSTNRAYTHW